MNVSDDDGALPSYDLDWSKWSETLEGERQQIHLDEVEVIGNTYESKTKLG